MYLPNDLNGGMQGYFLSAPPSRPTEDIDRGSCLDKFVESQFWASSGPAPCQFLASPCPVPGQFPVSSLLVLSSG